MDIGKIVNWATFLYWVFLALVWAARRWKGEATVHPVLKKLLASQTLMGVLILFGVLGQGATMYVNYRQAHPKLLESVTISAYPSWPETLQIIPKQTFENESVPLDGHAYDHCTFINVCLLYDGGAYQLQDATFKEHWKICVKEPQLKNYMNLADALHLLRPNVSLLEKSVIRQTAKTRQP